MKTWKIRALYYGETTCDRRHMANGLDPGLILTGPYLGFLLQNGNQNVLVDTGIHDRMIIDGKAWGGNPSKGGGQYVLDALAKAGLKPEDIDLVIYTHLHNDHAGNCLYFKNTPCIFQKDELHNLMNPLPSQKIRQDYDPETANEISQLTKAYTIDGDFELANGLRLYKVPGHTSGSQAILVPTEDGPRIITGDMPHMLFNLFPQMDRLCGMNGEEIPITPAPLSWGPYIINSVVYDHYAAYDSLDKLRLLAPEFHPKYYLVGHDAQALFDYPND